MAKHVRSLLNELKSRSERLLHDSRAALEFLSHAHRKLETHSGVFQSISAEVDTLIRLIRACVTGQYPEIPWRTLTWAGAALVYFVNPLDLVPDFIAGAGLVDDLAVFTYVLAMLKGELSKFRSWEADRARHP